jgi:hypothetical protein
MWYWPLSPWPQKSIEVIFRQKAMTFKVNLTLTFDPLTSKSKGVIYWSRPMHLCSLLAKGPWVVKLLIGNRITYNVNMTFDPLIPKSIGVIYVPRPIHLHCLKANSPWVVKLSMWPWSLTPNSIGVIYWLRKMHLCSFRAKGPWVVKLFIGNHFYLQGQYDLDL